MPRSERFTSDTLIQEVLGRRCAIISRGTRTDPRFAGAESIIASGIRATMAAPLMHGDDILGVVVLDSSRSLVAFTDDDLEVFETAARQLALSLHSLQLADSIREQDPRTGRGAAAVRASGDAEPGRTDRRRQPVDRSGRVRGVSVLFSDIRGFTCHERAADALGDGGTAQQPLRGDGRHRLRARGHARPVHGRRGDGDLLGAPVGQTDHAERAVRAVWIGAQTRAGLSDPWIPEPETTIAARGKRDRVKVCEVDYPGRNG